MGGLSCVATARKVSYTPILYNYIKDMYLRTI